MFQRNGLRLGDLTPPQRAAVMSLLTVALSRDGYRKVTEIMRGDEVLRNDRGLGRRRAAAPNAGRGAPPPGGQNGGRGRGAGGGVIFGEDEYYLAFVGTPSVTAPWMLQFGGHHLAINLTLREARRRWRPVCPRRSRRPTRSRDRPSGRWDARTTRRSP